MIEVKNVVKSFDGFRALDDLTMTVPHGAVYGLVGPQRRGQVHHHPPFGGHLPAGQRRCAGGRSAGI